VDDLTGVARGAETLMDVLADHARRGWTGQFASGADAHVECERCHHRAPAGNLDVLALRRLEGASDPDDMLAVVGIECPSCRQRGSLVLNFGPTATAEDAAVLVELGDAPHPTGHEPR
jgi:hypothetical protein